MKQKIRATETLFCKNILNSKNAKDVSKVSHHILNQKSTILEGNVGDIDKFFNYSAPRVIRKKPVKKPVDTQSTITSLPENNTTEQFEAQTTNSNEALQIIKILRSDCSTVYENILIFLIKPISEYISSPLAFVINNQILLARKFSKKWKANGICQISKVNKPETTADFRPISVLAVLSKFYERVIVH